MFVQVIQAAVKDRQSVASELERWQRELGPNADGYLGMTGGITQDGQFVGVIRFESEESARAQSNKPDQDQWWKSFSQHLESEASFFDSSGVSVAGQGGSDNAGFVQVMQGKVNDIEKAKEMDARMDQEMPQRRPDVIGSLTAYKEDGTFYSAIYFTSLEEARQGEKEMTENPPPEMEEWGQLMEGEMKFYDLEEPWLYSR